MNLMEEEILKKLEKEIKVTEDMINKSSLFVLKQNILKAYKKTLIIIKHFIPDYFIPIVLFIMSRLIGFGNPFMIDETNCQLITETKYTKDDKVISSYYETDSVAPEMSIKYYGSFIEEDGYYLREVTTYNITNFNPEMIDTYLNSSDKKLDTLLTKSSINRYEKFTNIDDVKTDYLEIKMYDKDANDFIILEESKTTNFSVSLLFILLWMFFEVPINALKDTYNIKHNKKRLSELLEDIEKQYELNYDDEYLGIKLKMLKSNYEMLGGEYGNNY